MDKLQSLINIYEKENKHFISSKYNEYQLRSDFLDPFFELLWWDIKNTKWKLTNEREVLLEEWLKEDSYSNTKKPDYTFRLYSDRKFFVEAKKPNVKIESDDKPAKQVRRYWFTAKLKISVLSNFEYLAIYDCSDVVNERDNVKKWRIKLYHYSEYIEKFEEIKGLIWYDSVYNWKFDEQWKNIENKLKTYSIDDYFLEQINEWRLLLWKEFFSIIDWISEEELNDIVQKYINSIIFLRVCEDRDLEEYKTLLKIADESNIGNFISKLKESDKKYNSGLFELNYIDEVISNNLSWFWTIIKKLYFPETSYSFSVFSSEILGHIYEVFLGQKLYIEWWEIVIKNKPENIDRDIVTTPTFIIKNILKETVENYCKWKSPDEILKYRFADISCGSGAFLLELFQILNDILIDYYIENDISILNQISENTYKLPFELRTKILTNCIYWVDKDYNAVEATKFWLLLKLLEWENNSTISTPALPSLDENIEFWNSLISSENIKSEEDNEIINPYDFKESFDVIIGNPPYMTTDEMKQILKLEYSNYYKVLYYSAYKQYDKYFLFIERGLNLLKKWGLLWYIVPNKFIKSWAWLKLREILQKNKSLKKIISFWASQIFEGKTTYTSLLFLENTWKDNLEYWEIYDIEKLKIRNIEKENFDEINIDNLDSDLWVLIPWRLKDIYNSIISNSVTLLDLLWKDNVFNWIQTSATSIYIHKNFKENENYFYINKDNREWKIEKEVTRPYYETDRTRNWDNFNTYSYLRPNSFIIFPYYNDWEKLELINLDDFPWLKEYLDFHKDKLNKRDIKPTPATTDEWYRYWRHQSLEKCDVESKIVVWVLSNWEKYSIDNNITFFSSWWTAGYCLITLPDDCKYSIFYIQALLNSKYLEWISSVYWEVFRWWYIARWTKVLNKLPIKIIDFENENEVKLHNEISSIQEKLINLNEQLLKTSKNSRGFIRIKRLFDLEKKNIEGLLFILFNLWEEDLKVPLIENLYE